MQAAAETLVRSGVAALQRGDPAAARAAFEQAVARDPASTQGWLYLAHTCAALADDRACDAALDRVLGGEPGNLYALCMKGDVAARRGDDRAATGYYDFALRTAPASGLSPDLIERLGAARVAVAAARARFEAGLAAALPGDPATHPPRFREAMAILSGSAPVQLQRPTSFYYPGLAPTPFFETEGLPWLDAMVAAAPAMKAELETLLADGGGFEAYVQADPARPSRGHALLDDPRWSALYLWRDGREVFANAARCPATMAALAEAPMPRIAGRSPMALFSMLRPGTHIPPHHGMLNTRLICHIPLIVPDGCRLRVGNETRAVRAFEPMLFDDSMEHEAWNDGVETRIVLLFEVWRPDLDPAERDLLARTYESVVGYGRDG